MTSDQTQPNLIRDPIIFFSQTNFIRSELNPTCSIIISNMTKSNSIQWALLPIKLELNPTQFFLRNQIDLTSKKNQY
jgi:hypothetical protein